MTLRRDNHRPTRHIIALVATNLDINRARPFFPNCFGHFLATQASLMLKNTVTLKQTTQDKDTKLPRRGTPDSAVFFSYGAICQKERDRVHAPFEIGVPCARMCP